jgi:ribonuclease T1
MKILKSPLFRKLAIVALILIVSSLSKHFASNISKTPTEVKTRNSKQSGFKQEHFPPEAYQVLSLIKQGGPFLYQKDGAIFENREKRLPQKKRGYYKEYTVKTPGSRDRGARRIISGNQGEYYYTDDHYRTFRKMESP